MNMSNYTQHLRSKYIYFTISHNIYQSLLFLTRRSHPAQPWRRPLMVRQPYSAAVLSTGGRLHPSRLRREGLVRMWSSLWLKGDGGIRKTFFNGKEGRVGFRKILLLSKEEHGVSITHTLQSPHNIPTV